MALKITRGDTSEITARFVDSSGDAIDLTGGTVFFTANATKAPTTDDAAVITKDITSFSDPTSGVQTITFSSTDTNITPGTYFYDIQFVSASGTVISNKADKLVISPDITRRVA